MPDAKNYQIYSPESKQCSIFLGMPLISFVQLHILSFSYSIIPLFLHLISPSISCPHLLSVMPHEHHNGSSYLWRSEMQIIVTLPFTLLLGLFLCWCTCKIQVDEDVFFYLGSSFIKISCCFFVSQHAVCLLRPSMASLTLVTWLALRIFPLSASLIPPTSPQYLSLSSPLSYMCTAVSNACDSTCSFIDESLSLLVSL